jgi:lysine 2,3-aminomutase
MAPNAKASDEAIGRAIDWIGQHPEITEVLVTGGDPAVLDDHHLDQILSALSGLDHVIRIRLGTRTPVVLPFRWTDALCDTLAQYHVPGRREVVVVTHFEHSYEITPEARDAVQQIRRRGISVYNQQVYTFWNSRRFESSKLRRDLRLIGVDPYYTFNTKGKKETRRYRVPIARLLLERTDEPVFNVPRLGKHHLRATQDRHLVMIRPETGARVYEFHPWEKNLAAIPPYLYDDIPIRDYLDRLAAVGEDPDDYRSIWYYF